VSISHVYFRELILKAIYKVKNLYRKNILKVCLFLFVFFTIIFTLYSYKEFFPTYSLKSYYQIIDSQEVKYPDVFISASDIDYFKKCNEDYECILRFYENYVQEKGTQKAFAHLALLNSYNDGEYIYFCHQNAHGIGHGTLRLSGNLNEAFSIFQNGVEFKNMSTCGTGYFHGVMEEYFKNEKNVEVLTEAFDKICNDKENYKYTGTDCIHGVGHTAYIQLGGDYKKVLAICDKVGKTERHRYSCYTGLFMQMFLDEPEENIMSHKTIENKEVFDFNFCNSLEEKYRTACFMENTVLFENHLKNKKDYASYMQYCKNIENELYRLACVKRVAIKSVGYDHYEDIKKLCIDSTQTKRERVFCVGTVASRVARSIDKKMTRNIHDKIVTDICKNLNIFEQESCKNLVLNNFYNIYFTSLEDFKIVK
jgi:hypothetical protein